MTLRTDEIKSSLTKKGFEPKDGKHKFFNYYYDGKKTKISTMISHSHKEIGDTLINKMSKQVKLSKDQFCKLVNCSLSGEEYKEILEAQDLI